MEHRPSLTFTRMGYLYQQVCSIFKFESFNTARIRRGRDYFAGLKVTKRNKATVLLTLTLLQTPTLTLTLILTLTLT